MLTGTMVRDRDVTFDTAESDAGDTLYSPCAVPNVTTRQDQLR